MKSYISRNKPSLRQAQGKLAQADKDEREIWWGKLYWEISYSTEILYAIIVALLPQAPL
jgi:hypothetical protein